MINSRLSPLVFLHPDGFVHHALAIGENVTAWDSLLDEKDNITQPVDLILWAPSAADCQRPGNLRSTAERIRAMLAMDGLVYAMIPLCWRAQAQRMLLSQGLEIQLTMAHLPNWSDSRYLIPLETGPVEYTFTRQFPIHLLKRLAAFVALRLPVGRRLVELGYPSAAFVARFPHSRPLFQWLYRQAAIQPKTCFASMAVRWKGERSSVVIHGYVDEPDPKIVAKTILTENGQYELGNEFRILEKLGPAARQAGAQIPQPLWEEQLGDHPVFLQSFLPGKCAAVSLAGHPERVEPTIERIITWLTAWNQSTAVPGLLNEPFLTHTFLEPLEIVAPLLADCAAYRHWLLDQCAVFQYPMKLVDAHNDLTMWNILLQPGGSIGVVDWREAQPTALPLGDLFYLYVDAVALALHNNHEQAFRQCLEPQGRYHNLFRAVLKQMQRVLDLPDHLVRLSLHACFLHHAANEQRERLPGEDYPFLHILRWLENNRLALELGEND